MGFESCDDLPLGAGPLPQRTIDEDLDEEKRSSTVSSEDPSTDSGTSSDIAEPVPRNEDRLRKKVARPSPESPPGKRRSSQRVLRGAPDNGSSTPSTSRSTPTAGVPRGPTLAPPPPQRLLIAFDDFSHLEPPIQRDLLKELTEKQLATIQQCIQQLAAGCLQKQYHITTKNVLDFIKLFGAADAACMRFLKVVGWKVPAALDRIARAILWRTHELHRLADGTRDVLDEFNAVPERSVFPCVGR